MATANDILKIAAAEVGVTEYPAGTNKCKYNTWFYGKIVSGASYPWCMTFVQWVYNQAGAKLPYVTASCSGLLNWYRENDYGRVTAVPKPGDIVIYNFGHTGIVESSTTYTITAIEGNTSSTEAGSQSNGGGVFRRTRSKSVVTAFIRPREISSTKQEDDNDMMTDQQIYEAVIRYSSALKVPESLQAEFQEAVAAGITDGSNPAKLIPRYQAALMALRAAKKAVELNGGCWECKV